VIEALTIKKVEVQKIQRMWALGCRKPRAPHQKFGALAPNDARTARKDGPTSPKGDERFVEYVVLRLATAHLAPCNAPTLAAALAPEAFSLDEPFDKSRRSLLE
jgi:hypothetical protein